MLKFKWETEFRETQIGEIPRQWEVKNIKSISYVNKSQNTNVSTDKIGFISMENIPNDGYVPSFEVVELNDIKSGQEVYPNTVLLAKITPSFEHGKMCVVPDIKGYRWFATTEVFSLNPKNNNDLKFIFYLLKHPALRDILENSMSGTSGRQRVPLPALKDLDIPHPSPTEQSRIASVLSWFDDLIENKKTQNEILEKTAMAIFKSWFIDFEPFKNGEFVYNSEWGREIPKEWEIKAIGEIANLRNGISYSGKEKYEELVEGSYIFITLNNTIEGGGFKPVFAWIKSHRLRKHHFLEEGDLIIPNTEQTKDERLLGSPGIVFFPYDYKNKKGVFSHHITKILPINPIYKLFLYLFLKFTREDSASFATGTGVLGLDINNFRVNKMIITPPSSILQKFHSLVEPLFQKIILNQKQIMVLRKVRDVLLPKLVFGKLRVVQI